MHLHSCPKAAMLASYLLYQGEKAGSEGGNSLHSKPASGEGCELQPEVGWISQTLTDLCLTTTKLLKHSLSPSRLLGALVTRATLLMSLRATSGRASRLPSLPDQITLGHCPMNWSFVLPAASCLARGCPTW